MNYKLSFKLSPNDKEVPIIPNIYHLTNDLQKLLKEYYGSNLKIKGYHFELDKFEPFHPEDFSKEVS